MAHGSTAGDGQRRAPAPDLIPEATLAHTPAASCCTTPLPTAPNRR
jgi:hypothetical protein